MLSGPRKLLLVFKKSFDGKHVEVVFWSRPNILVGGLLAKLFTVLVTCSEVGSLLTVYVRKYSLLHEIKEPLLILNWIDRADLVWSGPLHFDLEGALDRFAAVILLQVVDYTDMVTELTTLADELGLQVGSERV